LEEAAVLRETDPKDYIARSVGSMAVHMSASSTCRKAVPSRSTTATTFAVRFDAGCEALSEFPDLSQASSVHFSAKGRALSGGGTLGDPDDIRKTDELALRLFPQDETLNAGSPWHEAACNSKVSRAHLLARLRRPGQNGTRHQ